MSVLARYTTSNMASLFEDLYRLTETPKYFYNSRSRFNKVDGKSGKLEVELAGYTHSEIEVYTEESFLHISAKKEDGSRKYHNSWSISDNEKIDGVKYENGLLTVELSLVEPEKPKRTTYKIT